MSHLLPQPVDVESNLGNDVYIHAIMVFYCCLDYGVCTGMETTNTSRPIWYNVPSHCRQGSLWDREKQNSCCTQP